MDQMMISKLRECNNMPIYSVHDEEFKSYGRVVRGYDFSRLIAYMETQTGIPEKGNQYVSSVPEFEADDVKIRVEQELYGGLPIQIGFCNGRNMSYNGFEYHKCSEINIAVTDFFLVLGHTWEMEGQTFQTDKAKVFFVEKGTAIEMYQTTLHLSPCRVNDEGYMDIVILAKGTNTEFEEHRQSTSPEGEATILLKKNKWIIAHPDWEPLRKQGAYPGVKGTNYKLYYPGCERN